MFIHFDEQFQPIVYIHVYIWSYLAWCAYINTFIHVYTFHPVLLKFRENVHPVLICAILHTEKCGLVQGSIS